MLTEEQIDLIIERLKMRVEKANTLFLKNISQSIKAIKEISPTQAQQLVQILKYGGNYEKIIKELSKYTNLNLQDLDAIFEVIHANYIKGNVILIEEEENERAKK